MKEDIKHIPPYLRDKATSNSGHISERAKAGEFTIDKLETRCSCGARRVVSHVRGSKHCTGCKMVK